MKTLTKVLAVMAALAPGLAAASPVETSPRPMARAGGIMQDGPERIVEASANARFENWIKAFRSRALAQGISGRTFDRAFQNAEYDPDVIRRDRNPSEFTKTIWEYLDSAASDTRIANGKAALRKHRR